MAKSRNGAADKAPPDGAVRAALEDDAREMLKASGKDPEDPEALQRLLEGAGDSLERLMYTRAEAAVLCGFSLSTYLRMHEKGLGPPEIVFTPDVVRVSRRALDAWLAHRDMAGAQDIKASAATPEAKPMRLGHARAARSVGAAIGSVMRKRKKLPEAPEPPKKRKPAPLKKRSP